MPRDKSKHARERKRAAPPVRWLVALGLVAAVALAATVLVFGHVTAVAALVPLGLGVLAAARGRTWGVFVVLLGASMLIAAVALSVLPWWLFVPGAIAAVGVAAVGPGLLRADALATVAWATLATAAGTGAAYGAAELAMAPGGALTIDALDGEPARFAWSGDYVDPETAAHHAGRAEARRDLERGEPRWLTYGLPSADRPVYARLLEQRYGLELDAIAGCVVDGQVVGRARGYNEVVGAWLDETYGPDALDSAATDATALYRARLDEDDPRAEIMAPGR